MYVVELIQFDPPGSPTPGCGHTAGEIPRTFRTIRAAKRAARRRIGKPVHPAEFFPCCDWQDPKTPVARFLIVDADSREAV